MEVLHAWEPLIKPRTATRLTALRIATLRLGVLLEPAQRRASLMVSTVTRRVTAVRLGPSMGARLASVTHQMTVSAIHSLVLTTALRMNGVPGLCARRHARCQSSITATTYARGRLQQHQTADDSAPTTCRWSTAIHSSAPPIAIGLCGEPGALAARPATLATRLQELEYECETRSDPLDLERTAREKPQAPQHATPSAAPWTVRSKHGDHGVCAPRLATLALEHVNVGRTRRSLAVQTVLERLSTRRCASLGVALWTVGGRYGTLGCPAQRVVEEAMPIAVVRMIPNRPAVELLAQERTWK